MDPDKLAELVHRLINKTQAGELVWREGVRPGSYQLSFPDYSIIVQGPASKESEEALAELSRLVLAYSMSIINENGEVAVSLPEKGLLSPVLYQSVYQQMAHLVQEIRSSLGAAQNKVVDDLLLRLR